MSEDTNDNRELSTSVVRKSQELVLKYARSLANDERARQFVTQIAVMAKREPKFLKCSPESIATSMIACVHLDLMPNTPEGLAYIIPYENKQFETFDAQFQLGYKGLVQLAYRSGAINAINAELVFPEDDFEVDYGLRTLSHKPNLERDRTNYSEATAVYAVASLPNGGRAFEVMSRSEIDKIKNTVKAKSTDAPWSIWPEAMVKKTVIKRLAKVLPSSSKDKLQYATALDSWAEAGKLRLKDGQLVEDEIKIERSDEEKEAIKTDAKKLAEKVGSGANNDSDKS